MLVLSITDTAAMGSAITCHDSRCGPVPGPLDMGILVRNCPLLWRAAAREELRAVGVQPPPWWAREVFRTLDLVRENRRLLSNGGDRLIWWGALFSWNLVAAILATVLLLFNTAVTRS